MKFPPGLLDALSRTRILPLEAEASRGSGERRSRKKGSGIEFVDYRPYEAGDDLRHIDIRVKGRLGINVVRQHAVHQQLSVTIVLDGSASMRIGAPTKFEIAAQTAAILAYAGLVGGDRVQILVVSGGRVEPSGWTGGVRQFDRLVGFLGSRRAGPGTFIEPLERAGLEYGPPRSLVVVLSDWMIDDPARAFRRLRGPGHELLAIRVLDPGEADPAGLGPDALRLVDAETGTIREIVLSPDVRRQYLAMFDEWTGELRRLAAANNSRLVSMLTTDRLDHLATREWRRIGLLA